MTRYCTYIVLYQKLIILRAFCISAVPFDHSPPPTWPCSVMQSDMLDDPAMLCVSGPAPLVAVGRAVTPSGAMKASSSSRHAFRRSNHAAQPSKSSSMLGSCVRRVGGHRIGRTGVRVNGSASAASTRERNGAAATLNWPAETNARGAPRARNVLRSPPTPSSRARKSREPPAPRPRPGGARPSARIGG